MVMPSEVDPRIETSLGQWISDNVHLKMYWYTNREDAKWAIEGYLEIHDYSMVGNHVWVVGSGEGHRGFIFHSADGGNLWETQLQEPDFSFSIGAPGSLFFIVHFSSETEGWVGGIDGLLYTQDGGRNWEARTVTPEQPRAEEYWFYDDGSIKEEIYNQGNTGTDVSFDGGKTWSPSFRPSS
jgi:photosystem II stability/assembly factor-like uncharacterized protein